jgi:hypothetical protein
MQFRRNFSRLYRSPEPGDDGGTPVAADAAAVASPDTTAAAPAPEGAASAPSTMLEAMFGQKPDAAAAAAPTAEETAAAAATGKTIQQLRDERGRFASGKVETPPADPTKKPEAKPADPNAMPEGLSPKAQERFQTLANTNKQLTAQVAEFQPIVESAKQLQATFQQNGVKREQFDQAMEVVGLMNRGDLQGALRVLDEQRALISMALGKPLPGVDALGSFPDLRAAVDNFQITEEHALELARGRTVQNQQHQQSQRLQQDAQVQQQAQQDHESGVQAVDTICKRLQQNDLDYAVIEPMLLKEIQGGLLQNIPPSQWARIVEKTYGLIKQTASTVRSSGPSTSVLRPTGGESPRQTPKTMHEAMWGSR